MCFSSRKVLNEPWLYSVVPYFEGKADIRADFFWEHCKEHGHILKDDKSTYIREPVIVVAK